MNLRSSERQCFRKLQGVSKIKEEEANQVQETGVTSKQWKLGDFYFLLSLLICIFNRELGFLYWGKENNRKVFKEGLSNYWVEIETLIICCFQETNLKQNCTEKSKINVKKKKKSQNLSGKHKKSKNSKINFRLHRLQGINGTDLFHIKEKYNPQWTYNRYSRWPRWQLNLFCVWWERFQRITLAPLKGFSSLSHRRWWRKIKL